MKKYGIIGYPLGHTMSPLLHNWGFRQMDIDAEYQAWPITPEELPEFMYRLREEPIHGLSVTIPHKVSVMDFLDVITDEAQLVGAVNTLFWDDDILVGDNTDIIGCIAPLDNMELPDKAIILGAGGAARAFAAALMDLGIEKIAIANRTRSKAENLGEEFDIQVIDWKLKNEFEPGLIINTTPLGMSGEMVEMTPWDHAFDKVQIVFDAVYNPMQTKFILQAEKAGCRIINGLEMFLHQGLEQFRIWTDSELDEDDARNLLLTELNNQAPR